MVMIVKTSGPDVIDVLAERGQFWMWVKFDTEIPFTEIEKAAPCLGHVHTQVFVNGEAYLNFTTAEEMHEAYWRIQGDDQNPLNTYTGPARVYAYTSTGFENT